MREEINRFLQPGTTDSQDPPKMLDLLAFAKQLEKATLSAFPTKKTLYVLLLS